MFIIFSNISPRFEVHLMHTFLLYPPTTFVTAFISQGDIFENDISTPVSAPPQLSPSSHVNEHPGINYSMKSER